MSFSGSGSGSIGDPYIVTNAVQLDELRDVVTSDVFYAELANDIDLDVAPYNVGSGWDPLISVGKDEFKCMLDGKGYRIKNLFINRPGEDSVGFVGRAGNVDISSYTKTVISNILFDGVDITGRDDVGVLVGVNEHNVVSNCGVLSGSVVGRNRVGGLVGYNYHSPSDSGAVKIGEVDNCFSMASVTGVDSVGGFCGKAEIVVSTNSFTQTSIVNSYSVGGVVGDSNVGGFLGVQEVVYLYSAWDIGSVSTTVDCVWDVDTSGVYVSDSDAVGYSTSEMKSVTTYPSWDISRVVDFIDQTWIVLHKVDYPMLSVFQKPFENVYVNYDSEVLGGSNHYNGETSFSKLPVTELSEDDVFTISMWVYPETPSVIESLQSGVSTLGDFQLDVDYPGDFFPDSYIFNRGVNSPSITINGTGVGGSSELTTVTFRIGSTELDVFTNQVMNNNPYMLTLVYDKGVFRGYVNITESGVGYEKIDSGSFDMFLAAPIGVVSAEGSFFKGNISRVGFWRGRAFSYDEVVKLFNRASILPYDKFIIDNHVIRGVVDDVSYNYNDAFGFHIELDGRVNPELIDKTITDTFIASTGDVAIHSVLSQYKDDIVLEFWNGRVWASATFDEELGVLNWDESISGFPSTLINLSVQDEKGWTVIRRICDMLSLDCYVTFDTVRGNWILRLFVINSVGSVSSKEISHFRLSSDFDDHSYYENSAVVSDVELVGGLRDAKAQISGGSVLSFDSPSYLFSDYTFSFNVEVTDVDMDEHPIVSKSGMFSVSAVRQNGLYDLVVVMDSEVYEVSDVDLFNKMNNIMLERVTVGGVSIHRVFVNNKMRASGSILASNSIVNDSDIEFNKSGFPSMIIPIDESDEPVVSLVGDYSLELNPSHASIVSSGLNTNAVFIDGTGGVSTTESATVVNSGNLMQMSNSGMISLWFKIEEDDYELNKMIFRTAQLGMRWYLETGWVDISTPRVFFSARHAGGGLSHFSPLTLGVWNHLVINYKISDDPAERVNEYYLNGQLRYSFTSVVEAPGTDWTFGDATASIDEIQFYPHLTFPGDPFLAAIYNDGNGGYFEISNFIGNVNDVRMFNMGLSPEERFKIVNNMFGNRLGVSESTNNVTQGVNLMAISDFKENHADVINRVKVYGQDVNNLFYLHTVEDTQSQDLSWVRDRVITDNTLTSNSDVRERALLELDKLKINRISGTVTAVGLPSVAPGEVLNLSVPNCNANNVFRVHDITHSIGSDFTTTISVASKMNSLTDIFVGRFNPDELVNFGNNVNNMKYAYNVFFEEDPSLMSHVGTSEFNGRLRLNSEVTSGVATSGFVEMPENIQFCELRRIENYDTDNDTYEVTNNGGVTWEVLTPFVAEGVTALAMHQFTSVGNNVGFRINMNRNVSTDPTPMYDGISLLCK